MSIVVSVHCLSMSTQLIITIILTVVNLLLVAINVCFTLKQNKGKQDLPGLDPEDIIIPDDPIDIIHTQFDKPINPNEQPPYTIERLKGPQLDAYMQVLDEMQIEEYDVKKCVEDFTHNCTRYKGSKHDAYLYHIYQDENLVVLVFESVWSSCASLVFPVSKSQLERAEIEICRYLSSTAKNKRDTIKHNCYCLADYGIPKIYYLCHDDFEKWKNSIHNVGNWNLVQEYAESETLY